MDNNTKPEQHMKIDLVAKTVGDSQVSVECEISGECGIKFAVGVLREIISKSELLQEALPIALLDFKIRDIEESLSKKED